MASIFDYSSYGMSPAEIAAMEAEVKKQRPYINPNKLPSTVNKGLGGLVGEYIPAENSSPRSSGLLEAPKEPVATQQQSRVSARQPAGRTFYANTAGDVGTSVPKGSGTSGIYGAAEEVAPKVGKSLMKMIGKTLGPLGLAYDIANPEAVGDAELTAAQREAKNPGETADAQAYARRVQENAARASGNRPVSLLAPEMQMNEPLQSPMTAQAANSAPDTVSEAAKATKVQMETQRQAVEQGAVKGLSTGAVSRPEFAEAIVDADIQRSGKSVTPEVRKQAVAAELTNMKTMDDKDVSKYISYALAAAGFLAAVLDKSGRAGDAFSASFNKQLDRNLAGGLATQKQRAAQAKMDQDLAIKLEEFKRDDRGLDIRQQSADQTGAYQDRSLDQGDQRIGLQAQGLNLQAAGQAQSAAQAGASLSLRQQAMAQRQAQADRMYALQERAAGRDDQRVVNENTGLLIRADQAATAKAKANREGGIDLTDAMAKDVVTKSSSALGYDLDAGTKAAVALQLKNKVKKDPKAAANPTQALKEILMNSGDYDAGSSTSYTPAWLGGQGMGTNSPRFRQKKATK